MSAVKEETFRNKEKKNKLSVFLITNWILSV